jgi:hypothetical protein
MERNRIIRDFWKFLDKTKDDKNSLPNAIEYLNTLIRTKTCVPPTIEIITVLRNERPVLFRFLRDSISPSSPIRMLLALNMSYEDAKNRLSVKQEHNLNP